MIDSSPLLESKSSNDPTNKPSSNLQDSPLIQSLYLVSQFNPTPPQYKYNDITARSVDDQSASKFPRRFNENPANNQSSIFNNEVLKKASLHDTQPSSLGSQGSHHPSFSFSTDKKQQDFHVNSFSENTRSPDTNAQSNQKYSFTNEPVIQYQNTPNISLQVNGYSQGRPSLTERISPKGLNNMTSSKHFDTSPKKYSVGSLGASASSSQLRGGDLKNSTSYINAMKALQTKIKTLEKELEARDNDLSLFVQNKQQEFENFKMKTMEERSSWIRVENNLKQKIQLLENELNDKQKLLEAVTDENAQLREQVNVTESERSKEFESTIREKTNYKSHIHQLELQVSEHLRLIEDLRRELFENQQEFTKYEMDIKFLNDKVTKLENDKRDIKISYENRTQDLAATTTQLERKIYDIQNDFDKEMKQNERTQSNLKSQINHINKQLEDLESSKKSIFDTLKEKEREIWSQQKELTALKHELQNLTQENHKTKALSDYTKHFAQDVATVNEKLINSLLESTKVKAPQQFDFEKEVLENRQKSEGKPKDIRSVLSSSEKTPKIKSSTARKLLNDSISTENSPKDEEKKEQSQTLRSSNLENRDSLSLANTAAGIKNGQYQTPNQKSNVEYGSSRTSNPYGDSNSKPKLRSKISAGSSGKDARKNSVTWADSENRRAESLENLYYNTSNTGKKNVKTKDLATNELAKSIRGRKYESEEDFNGGISSFNGANSQGNLRSVRNSNTLSAAKERVRERDSSEDRYEYERVIKAIIDMEKEIVSLNKEYQSEIGTSSKDENGKNRKQLSELSIRLQMKNEELIKLKKREEELMSKFNF